MKKILERIVVAAGLGIVFAGCGTFHPNGGSPNPGSFAVTEGNTVGAPALIMTWTPSEGGLYQGTSSFGGWYTNMACTIAWNFTAPVTGDLDLYAKWSDTSIDVSGYSGNTLDQALAYIDDHPLGVTTNYTILLEPGPSYTMSGTSIINTENAVITLVGKGPAETEISRSPNGALFNISRGELILDNNITLQGHAGNNASLVYVNASATLTMKAGATISGNTTDTYGGGVYVSGGIFTMEGGTISDNTTATATGIGGGVYVSSGSFTMKAGATISDNTAGYNGGGVYVSSGSFTMEGGTISGNTTSATGNGGGVYVSIIGSFNKSGTSTINGGPGPSPNNTAHGGSSGFGHAVYTAGGKYRDDTVSAADEISVISGVPDGPWD